ncbi:tyrosine-protein phosphatase non-receptor type 18-like [Gouania willdenowi]|uniref:tyrosine-protein phosphatase non-receptor type 18-like n=1 Tax=Gouania willdenowi TaxID=441366 RepID=UPI001055F637|nr:tyrosine-protein phosphatase non-receptor type 18-like [Gouania willdenowi]XP_028308017.1 tyrosine-protein phosphatase non-receptor type 18-like [Gouania willdenowi]XP_028308018.1 tyrosine-protein phosphatase non-receptor type 18-like [Gouania willdenowi]XP_028308019.1 tyrosine-protein phosphatase non-receptor type 18-like [Gouania willdenowi]XP_028308020.1 tyrosine-protein phosphatase non-receptor type 18-like [Gouania willdenowi]
MNDMYAVVNKQKQPRPCSHDPTYSTLAPPTHSSASTPLHYYDNDPSSTIYSVVKKSPTTNQRPTTGSGEGQTASENDYEDLSCVCRPEDIGFNCRVQKPKGPRGAPSDWTHLQP